MNEQIDKTLDTSGLLCPEPVMMLHKVVKEVAVGKLIEVIATDPSTQRDIPKFCLFLGYELVEQKKNESQYIYYIRRNK